MFAAIEAVRKSRDVDAGGKAFHDEAKAKGWTVISMKNDWKRIFDWEK